MVAKNEPPTADRELVISRVIHFPRQLVWDAMTDPKHIVNWWGPRGFTTTIEKMEVRPGGRWKFVMHGPDGADYPQDCIFTEVEAPERIVYHHSGSKTGEPIVNSVKTFTFDALEDNSTRVTIRMLFSSREERDSVVKTYGAVEGGKQTLARLAELLIRQGEPFVIERIYLQPVAKVWPAVSTREGIEKWFFDFVGFQPELGSEFSFLVEHEGTKYDHRCVVTEVVPEKKIVFTWRYHGHAGDSLVTIELFPEKDGTRLKLTHDGLDNFEKRPEFDRGRFSKGWTSLIGEELPKSLTA